MLGYTIQHSIELLEKKIKSLGSGGASTAADVTYDNTSSGLAATNVQAAIDETDTALDSALAQIANIPLIDISTTEKKIGTYKGKDLFAKIVTTTISTTQIYTGICGGDTSTLSLSSIVDECYPITNLAGLSDISALVARYGKTQDYITIYNLGPALTSQTIDIVVVYTKAALTNTRSKKK